jgi:hypothetical protein
MATIEEIRSSPGKTVVSGPAVVAAATKPAVISFWEKARAYGASMVANGRDHSR